MDGTSYLNQLELANVLRISPKTLEAMRQKADWSDLPKIRSSGALFGG